ncbi:MAG: magnesium transporter [Wolbachia endosymbiont of Halictus tumulorum]|nr:magnesium transporter [Wolbachia endosymbiont of Halictus tumulorum]
MSRYEDLTKKQEELYNKLKYAIKNEKNITPILEEIKKEVVLKEFLTTANIIEELEDGTKYNLTPLAYAMNCNNFKEKIKVILEEIGDKKEVLTTANITEKLPGGTEYNLTPLGYAMNFNNFEEIIKVILDVAQKNSVLEELLNSMQESDRANLKKILESLKSKEQDEEQETKIDNWLAILADSISSCESNEKPLVPESSVPRTEENIVKTTCKSNEKPLVPESSVPRTEENIVKTTNKSIMIGSVCGVVVALAVGGGCFAAGVALPILALIGIAVAAFVLTGLVTGGITYEVCKPCNELNEVDLQSEISSKSSVTV